MIHTSYTVGITTGEYKALQTVMVDQHAWIETSLKVRESKAIKEVTNEYIQYKINKGEAITAIGTTAIIEAALAEGVVGIAT